MIALQGEDEPVERRRRAVARGRTALDALDELKAEVLSGELSPATLRRLKTISEDIKDTSGDPGLDGLLSEIELRVQVELAKLTPR